MSYYDQMVQFMHLYPTPASHPNGGDGDWADDCAAWCSRFGEFINGVANWNPTRYGPSAFDVAMASGTLNTDWTKAPPGAQHFFRNKGGSGRDGHVGTDALGGGTTVGMATGGLATVIEHDVGFNSIPGYLAMRPAIEYLGWSMNYAGAVLAGGTPLKGYQRQVGADGVNRRALPSSGSALLEAMTPGEVLDFDTFCHGENPYGTNDIWFNGRYSDTWFYSGAFTDSGTHDLTEQPAPGAPPAAAAYYRPNLPGMLLGIDLSKSQAGFDYHGWAAAGEDFAIVKAAGANDGLYIAGSYADHLAGVRAAGKLVGHYVFNGREATPAQLAAYVLAHADIREGETVWLDVEDESTSAGTVAHWSPAEAIEFLRALKAADITAGVYASRSVVAGDAAWAPVAAAGFPLWVAAWGSNDGTLSAEPDPITWPGVATTWAWTIWQWTSKTNGAMPGTSSTQLDRNLARLDTWTKYGRKPSPTPPVDPTTDPTTPAASKANWLLWVIGGLVALVGTIWALLQP